MSFAPKSAPARQQNTRDESTEEGLGIGAVFGVDVVEGVGVVRQDLDDALGFGDEVGALLPGVGGGLAGDEGFVAGLEVFDEGFLVGLGVVNEAAEVMQAFLLEPEVDDVDGGAFFADEEDAFSAGGEVGDEVGDGLAFAGAGRALDDDGFAFATGGDGARLGGVAVDDVVAVGEGRRGGGLGVEGAGLGGEELLEGGGGLLAGDEVCVVAHEGHFAVVEVADGHCAEVEFPGVGIGGALAQGVGGALFLGGHVFGRGIGGGKDVVKGDGRGAHAAHEELQAEGLEVAGGVGVVEVFVAADATAGEAGAATVLVETFDGAGVDDVDAGLVDELEVDAGFAGLDHGLEDGVELFHGGLLEVDGFGEVEVVELLEVVAEGGVDLGDGGDGPEQVAVADAAFFLELDGEQEEGGVDAGVGLFFEVVPTKEAEDEAELGKAEFVEVFAGLGAGFVEGGGKVGVFVEPDVALEGDAFGAGEAGADVVVPDEEVLGADVFEAQEHGDGGFGEVGDALGGLEVDEAVALGDLEEAVAEGGEDEGAAVGEGGLLEAGAGEVEGGVGGEVAVVGEAMDEDAEVLEALVAVERGGLDDGLFEDGVEVGSDGVEVGTVADEELDVVGVVEVELEGVAGEEEADDEGVGEGVVVVGDVFPGEIAAGVDGLLEGAVLIGDVGAGDLDGEGGEVLGEVEFVDDFDGGGEGLLDLFDLG